MQLLEWAKPDFVIKANLKESHRIFWNALSTFEQQCSGFFFVIRPSFTESLQVTLEVSAPGWWPYAFSSSKAFSHIRTWAPIRHLLTRREKCTGTHLELSEWELGCWWFWGILPHVVGVGNWRKAIGFCGFLSGWEPLASPSSKDRKGKNAYRILTNMSSWWFVIHPKQVHLIITTTHTTCYGESSWIWPNMDQGYHCCCWPETPGK
jgi:hypothetical protein